MYLIDFLTGFTRIGLRNLVALIGENSTSGYLFQFVIRTGLSEIIHKQIILFILFSDLHSTELVRMYEH